MLLGVLTRLRSLAAFVRPLSAPKPRAETHLAAPFWRNGLSSSTTHLASFSRWRHPILAFSAPAFWRPQGIVAALLLILAPICICGPMHAYAVPYICGPKDGMDGMMDGSFVWARACCMVKRLSYGAIRWVAKEGRYEIALRGSLIRCFCRNRAAMNFTVLLRRRDHDGDGEFMKLRFLSISCDTFDNILLMSKAFHLLRYTI